VNKATRVCLMRDGVRTVLSMSNDYDGPPEDFAMVVPVPVVLVQESVRTLPHDVFDHIESLTAPRLVEYWEQDPCAESTRDREGPAIGRGSSGDNRRYAFRNNREVRVEAQFAVGEYEVVVLSATQSNALETWLRENRYNIPSGAAEYLAPFVREEWKFFVARVNITRVQRRPDGGARLSPLRFHYDAQDFRLPVRLGLLNASGAQDLIVYVLHPRMRFEVANHRNVFIRTNLDVDASARERFPELYARLFDETLERFGGAAVVTEYAWNTNSCDPCPSPTLTGSDLATLGADALGQGQPGLVPVARYGSMVVTRLHTRYDRATLSEDLIFREAVPVVGGREHSVDGRGQLESEPRADFSTNAFQARYAIRHRWTGPISCRNPVRGIWGGPPGGNAPPVLAARDLASVPRGRITTAAFHEPARPGERGSAGLLDEATVEEERRHERNRIAVAAALGGMLVGALVVALFKRRKIEG
jgi:hypothetical protein